MIVFVDIFINFISGIVVMFLILNVRHRTTHQHVSARKASKEMELRSVYLLDSLKKKTVILLFSFRL